MVKYLFDSYSGHIDRLEQKLKRRWIGFWMRRAGFSKFGRFAAGCAAFLAPPHTNRVGLVGLNPIGFIAPSAVIHHSDLSMGKHIYMDDRTVIYQKKGGGSAILGNKVMIYRDTIIETGVGGSIVVEDEVSLHPRCQIMAYLKNIHIGKGTMVAPNCAMYCYDHGTAAGRAISEQELVSKGDIDIGKDAWIGVGATILSGVTIGPGAVIAAGSVVTKSIPPNAIAGGNPAKILRYR